MSPERFPTPLSRARRADDLIQELRDRRDRFTPERCREIRVRARLSQQQLAVAAGAHWRSICTWERRPGRSPQYEAYLAILERIEAELEAQ
jgi:DNA-binding transcriptional regulator YiaG